jgi:hypothetical protein
MTVKKFLLIGIVFILFSCEEEKRFDINSDDKVPPAAPVISRCDTLNGAVKIYFTPPSDEDVASIEAMYTRDDGKVFRFSTSYFATSIEVNGLAQTKPYTIYLSAVDRAGNRSYEIPYVVTPLESAISKVNKSMVIKGGFDAVFVKWTNELREPVNVYIDYTFSMDGVAKNLTKVFTASDRNNWYYINDLVIPTDAYINVKYRVSDGLGNVETGRYDTAVHVLKDVILPKFDHERNPLWYLPEAGNIPLAPDDNVEQVGGNQADGVFNKVVDDIIDMNENLNFMFSDRGLPWNLIIDLQKKYELSRILTHQRHTWKGSADDEYLKRGGYYRISNIQRFRTYYWAEDDSGKGKWELTGEHTIPIPYGTLSELEWNKLGRAGDMNYLFPDDPGYTPPTRYFRYEAMSQFGGGVGASCLSEITLYAKDDVGQDVVLGQ